LRQEGEKAGNMRNEKGFLVIGSGLAVFAVFK
jgi:hypothetical protein